MAKEEFNAFLGAGTFYRGQLHFSGAVRIDGEFIGDIKSEGTLILGKGGKVQGNVNVSQLILSGCLDGEVVVSQKIVMHKSACLTGTVSTPALIMEEGAALQGTIAMGRDVAAISDVAPLVGDVVDAQTDTAGYSAKPYQ